MADPYGGNIPLPRPRPQSDIDPNWQDWLTSRIPRVDPGEELKSTNLNQDIINILKNTPGGGEGPAWTGFTKGNPNEASLHEAMPPGYLDDMKGIQPNLYSPFEIAAARTRAKTENKWGNLSPEEREAHIPEVIKAVGGITALPAASAGIGLGLLGSGISGIGSVLGGQSIEDAAKDAAINTAFYSIPVGVSSLLKAGVSPVKAGAAGLFGNEFLTSISTGDLPRLLNYLKGDKPYSEINPYSNAEPLP